MKKRNWGFTLVEIMIVVVVVGLLATMAMPTFVRARSNSQTAVCLNNLRMILTAKSTVALENNLSDGATVDAEDIDPFLKRAFAEMVEPAGESYEIRPVGEDPICTFGGDHAL